MTDHEIIAGCIKNQANAYKALVDIYASKLMAVAFRYLNNKEMAEDVIQDSYIQIFNAMSHYEDRGQLFAWLKRIVINNCLKVIRNRLDIIQIDEVVFSGTVHNQGIENMKVADILALLKGMPTQYSIVFNLHVIEGYQHNEIAEMLSIPESTSRVYLTRARSYLKEYLIKEKIG